MKEYNSCLADCIEDMRYVKQELEKIKDFEERMLQIEDYEAGCVSFRSKEWELWSEHTEWCEFRMEYDVGVYTPYGVAIAYIYGQLAQYSAPEINRCDQLRIIVELRDGTILEESRENQDILMWFANMSIANATKQPYFKKPRKSKKSSS